MSTETTTPAVDRRDAEETRDTTAAVRPRRDAPATVVNGPRVTIAFPFSNLTVSEATSEIRLLAQLVAELADALATTPDDDAVESLRQRAHALRDGLGATSRT